MNKITSQSVGKALTGILYIYSLSKDNVLKNIIGCFKIISWRPQQLFQLFRGSLYTGASHCILPSPSAAFLQKQCLNFNERSYLLILV